MSQMHLVITIRKKVTDRDQGELIFRLVEQRLSDRPDLELSGHVSNHFDLSSDPPPP